MLCVQLNWRVYARAFLLACLQWGGRIIFLYLDYFISADVNAGCLLEFAVLVDKSALV